MAVIEKLGNKIGSTNVTSNVNFLSPLGFRFLLNRVPNVEYFCQAASLPSISMNEVVQQNPFVSIPRPGDKITYEPLSLRFRIDEDMTNYLEIYNWIVGLGYPDSFNQYKNLSSIVSDGSIIILTSNNNPSIRIAFNDLFPLSLSPLAFDVSGSDVEYLEAEVSFRYTKFSIEKL